MSESIRKNNEEASQLEYRVLAETFMIFSPLLVNPQDITTASSRGSFAMDLKSEVGKGDYMGFFKHGALFMWLYKSKDEQSIVWNFTAANFSSGENIGFAQEYSLTYEKGEGFSGRYIETGVRKTTNWFQEIPHDNAEGSYEDAEDLIHLTGYDPRLFTTSRVNELTRLLPERLMNAELATEVVLGVKLPKGSPVSHHGSVSECLQSDLRKRIASQSKSLVELLENNLLGPPGRYQGINGVNAAYLGMLRERSRRKTQE